MTIILKMITLPPEQKIDGPIVHSGLIHVCFCLGLQNQIQLKKGKEYRDCYLAPVFYLISTNWKP